MRIRLFLRLVMPFSLEGNKRTSSANAWVENGKEIVQEPPKLGWRTGTAGGNPGTLAALRRVVLSTSRQNQVLKPLG